MTAAKNTIFAPESYYSIKRNTEDKYSTLATRAVLHRLCRDAAFAAHTVTFGGMRHALAPGQLIFGRDEFAERCLVSVRKFRTALAQLTAGGDIMVTTLYDRCRRPIGTLVTVLCAVRPKAASHADQSQPVGAQGFHGSKNSPNVQVIIRELEKKISIIGAPAVPPKIEGEHMIPIPIQRAKHRIPPKPIDYRRMYGISLLDATSLMKLLFDADSYTDPKAVEKFTSRLLTRYGEHGGDIFKRAVEYVEKNAGYLGGKSFKNQRRFFEEICHDDWLKIEGSVSHENVQGFG